MRIIVTGGAGFIGSALIRYVIKNTKDKVLNIDSLTYASSEESLSEVVNSERYMFKKVDICNYDELEKAVFEFEPNIIIHLAAETHVDRSINGPAQFIRTNIIGTFNLLEVIKSFQSLKKTIVRLHHVSTDEVFGEIEDEAKRFCEDSKYMPNSPYSASKASSDHLVRAWGKTYGIQFVITNCSNNYGPFQNSEKLIPNMIQRALDGRKLTVYGNGMQIRDWLYVDDHVEAIYKVATEANVGETYLIGGNCEKRNIDVVKLICFELDKLAAISKVKTRSHVELIEYVEDRPGHDFRYAIDASKIKSDLGWFPKTSFEEGMLKTIRWYIEKSNKSNFTANKGNT